MQSVNVRIVCSPCAQRVLLRSYITADRLGSMKLDPVAEVVANGWTDEPYDRGCEMGASVFLMVRFSETEMHDEISRAISATLEEYGLRLRRADWRQIRDELWANVCYYMDTAKYGIAVFEEIEGRPTSPNVSLELGYMLAKGKRCLLLKERHVKILQADLAGHLCREFDGERIKETVGTEVRAWLRDLGIAKRANERILVFISYGGTCRDPMAKVVVEQLMKERPPPYRLRVEAMALGPISKAQASINARRVVEKSYGCDLLAEHQPVQITERIIADADLILVMDHTLLTKNLPLKKTYVLKHFFGIVGDVVDPWPDYGNEESLQRYANCLAELQAVLEAHYDNLINWLAQPTE